MRRRIMPSFIGEVVELNERQDRVERVMQMLGVTPEYPYTFNINDGARNRVEIGVIGSDYGIRVTDALGNEVILANGTIVANAIKTGTLDCDLITVANLSASVIITGSLSATRISGGTLDCNLMTVTNLNAGSITVGTFANPNDRFTTGSISGIKLSDGTITGVKLVAYTIQADNLATNSISSDKIQAGAIIATKISVSTLSAISANLGTITAGTINAATVNVQNLNADNLNRGTINVGNTGQPSQIYIRRNGSNGYLNWEGGNKIWSDENQYMGFSSNGGKFYFYSNGLLSLTLQRGSPSTFSGDGVDIGNGGGLYVDGNFRVNGHVSGDMNFDNHNLNNTNVINNTQLNGNNIYYWNLYYYSDEILKKNIKKKNGGLTSIGKLNPIEFDYKAEKGGKKHLGFSAQEVEKVLPNLVHKNEEGVKSIKMIEMIPLLVGAIQELKKEVELLKKEKL